MEEIRPIYGYCIECNKPIYADDDAHYGDDIVEFPDGPMHYDCAIQWCRSEKKEARFEQIQGITA